MRKMNRAPTPSLETDLNMPTSAGTGMARPFSTRTIIWLMVGFSDVIWIG